MRNLKHNVFLLVLAGLLFSADTALAWGRRGHQIVAESAARVVAQEPKAGFLKNHGFDLGYYANVPDFIWKRPATYEQEKNQHFMDLEIFQREFLKRPEIKEPLALSRQEFETTFPEIKVDAGRAFWRIRELVTELDLVTELLRKNGNENKKERRQAQEKWLLLAGVLAHYVGDLSMPLHVSENYDGQLTGQKGVHSYFEDQMVNELSPELAFSVSQQVLTQWSGYAKANKKVSLLTLLDDLSKKSQARVRTLLSLDKKMNRSQEKQNAKAYKKLITDCLADGALVLAEIYRRQVGWDFDADRFYFFAGEPEYIVPGTPRR